MKIVYCAPSLYMRGGFERVIALKSTYFAEYLGYDITIILTDGKDKDFAYELSPKIQVVNLDINSNHLYQKSFIHKIIGYHVKQYKYKKRLEVALCKINPVITISTVIW